MKKQSYRSHLFLLSAIALGVVFTAPAHADCGSCIPFCDDISCGGSEPEPESCTLEDAQATEGEHPNCGCGY